MVGVSAVLFDTNAPNARFTVNCHCTACQKTSGASYVSYSHVPISAVEVSGEVRRSVRTGDTGGKLRMASARSCGSRIFSYAESAGWAHEHHGHEPR